jgi:RNA polymerase sigma factor (sigma-70 family)
MPKPVTQQEWNHWYNLVYGYFFRRVNSRAEADELTSDTVTDFFLKDQEIDNPKAFIFGIARHKLYKHIDHKSKRSVANLEDHAENLSYADVEEHYSDNYLAKTEDLKNCVERQLKPQDQDIVELCVVCEFSSERVADELSLNAPNVRQRLSRALKKLREKCREIWLQFA